MSAKDIDDQSIGNQTSEDMDSSYDEPYEDDVTYTEDDQWSDEDDDSVSDEVPPKKKKTSNLTIAIIVVVAVIGVFGFMMLKGNKGVEPQPVAENQGDVVINADADQANSPSDAPINADNSIDQPAQNSQGGQAGDVQTPVQPSSSTEPQQGLMDDPNLLQDGTNKQVPTEVVSEQTIQQDAQPSGLTPPSDLGTPPVAAAPSEEVVNAISPTVKPVSDFPTVDSIKKPEAEPAPVMTGAIASDTDTLAPEINEVGKSAELSTQVDAAQAKIASLEKQLADQAEELKLQKQAATEAMGSVSKTSGASELEVAELKGRIADLEEKLAAKEEKISESNFVQSSAPEVEEVASSKPVDKKVVVENKAKPSVKQVWSLKSAGVGKAILADKVTGDLKTVRVGDIVPGLGRIVSISNSNSFWVVKGTLGSVSE